MTKSKIMYIRLLVQEKKWFLEDTEFKHQVWHCDPVKAIMDVYPERNLPVLPNLKIYYTGFSNNINKIIKQIKLDSRFYDKYTEYDFTIKYYNCLISYFRKLEFIGKYR